MFKTEREFSISLSGKLRKCGYVIQRIESHSTSVGIPDMFVQGYGDDFWLELKNDSKLKGTDKIKVAWRPGQKGWQYDYHLFHSRKKQVVTLISGASGIYIVPVTDMYCNNTVKDPWFISYDDWHELSVAETTRLMYMSTNNIDIKQCNTYRDALIVWVEHYYYGLDDWDPAVVWSSCKQDIDVDDSLDPSVFYKQQFNIFMELNHYNY